MSLPVVLRPAAAADIEDAYRWYQEERPGAGGGVSGSRPAPDGRHRQPSRTVPVIRRQTRRALRQRFPYAMFYRVRPSGIVVVACFHAKRDPRIWRSRH